MWIKKQRGISLLEVLAAIFVVSIGLLGVLAVIPFGAFQISKAQHAEYASNMLANAAQEVIIRQMTNPETWDDPDWDDAQFVWIEPRVPTDVLPHIVRFDATSVSADWTELMRGQDDLVYNIYDDRRPDFRLDDDDNPVIQSSGKYTWFCTFLPSDSSVAVDVLACYNRVPEDDQQVQVSGDEFVSSRRGGTFTFPTADASLSELLSQTQYVFVTWGTSHAEGGAWCRIVFVDRSNPSSPKIIVTGGLDAAGDNKQVYIPSGVLYHKRVTVPIR